MHVYITAAKSLQRQLPLTRCEWVNGTIHMAPSQESTRQLAGRGASHDCHGSNQQLSPQKQKVLALQVQVRQLALLKGVGYLISSVCTCLEPNCQL